MNSIKIAVAVSVFGALLVGSIGNALAVSAVLRDENNSALGYHLNGTDTRVYDLDQLEGNDVTQGFQIINLQGDTQRIESAVADAKAAQNTRDLNQDTLISTNGSKADNALQDAAKNGADIISLQNETNLQGQVLTNHDQRITDLENAPKPTNGKDGINGIDGINGKDGAQGVTGANGVDGKNGINGKDGVTTTVTQLDTATQAKVAKNSQAITATSGQAASVAQDLKDAKSFFSQQQASNNAQFKSLHDEVDSNKKESRSGAASAVAIASMPQVEVGQTVMFSAGVGSFKDEQAMSVGASFHAGVATVKAGISDSTNNDFAMGAGVGIGF